MDQQDLERLINLDTDLTGLSTVELSLLSRWVKDGHFCVLIPRAMRLRGHNTEMNAYRLMVLIKLYNYLYSTMLKKDIYQDIRLKYGYFVSDRQFNNIIKSWNESFSDLKR